MVIVRATQISRGSLVRLTNTFHLRGAYQKGRAAQHTERIGFFFSIATFLREKEGRKGERGVRSVKMIEL